MELLALGLSAISVLFILIFAALNYWERLRNQNDNYYDHH